MNACGKCGAALVLRDGRYRCAPCHRAYAKAWRERRKTEGKSISGASFLASLIVIFEARVLDDVDQFDFEQFAETLREAVKAGHGPPERKVQ